jgi:hypothetical protein
MVSIVHAIFKYPCVLDIILPASFQHTLMYTNKYRTTDLSAIHRFGFRFSFSEILFKFKVNKLFIKNPIVDFENQFVGVLTFFYLLVNNFA